MTRKEELIEEFERANDNDCEYVAVAIETRGSNSWEIILNPKENFDIKLAYYIKAYNDDLVLNTYDGIRIASVCGLPDYTTLDLLKVVLEDNEF